MKNFLALGILALLVGCGSDTASTTGSGSPSGNAAASAAPTDVADPTDEQEKADTADLTPANAESELAKLEQDVSADY